MKFPVLFALSIVLTAFIGLSTIAKDAKNFKKGLVTHLTRSYDVEE